MTTTRKRGYNPDKTLPRMCFRTLAQFFWNAERAARWMERPNDFCKGMTPAEAIRQNFGKLVVKTINRMARYEIKPYSPYAKHKRPNRVGKSYQRHDRSEKRPSRSHNQAIEGQRATKG